MISTLQSTPLYRNEEFLRQMYLEKQLSTRQIAREIRSARSTVKEALCDFRIPIRHEDEAHAMNKGQLGFGERMVSGKIVPHQSELRVLHRMIELRKRGQSLDKIAEWLNKNEVPTKNRSKQWSRPTVYKILRRASSMTKLRSGDVPRLAASSPIH